MIFATDLHHVMLIALTDSYSLLVPGQLPAFGDLSQTMVTTLSRAFALGLQLSAPFVMFGLVFISTYLSWLYDPELSDAV